MTPGAYNNNVQLVQDFRLRRHLERDGAQRARRAAGRPAAWDHSPMEGRFTRTLGGRYARRRHDQLQERDEPSGLEREHASDRALHAQAQQPSSTNSRRRHPTMRRVPDGRRARAALMSDEPRTSTRVTRRTTRCQGILGAHAPPKRPRQTPPRRDQSKPLSVNQGCHQGRVPARRRSLALALAVKIGSMDVPRWNALLLLIVAGAAATPALAQDVAPAYGTATTSGITSAASIPDFSGIWAHFTWPDFEPPAAGPGPVTNRSRRDGVPDAYQLVGDHTSPILKPKSAEIVKQHGETSLRGVTYPTPSNQCWPGGVPFVLVNIGMQMLQQPDRITILYSQRSRSPPRAHEPAASGARDAIVVWGFRRPLRRRYAGDRHRRDQGRAVCDGRHVRHAAHPALHVVERYRLLDYEAAKIAEERGQRGLSRLGRDPGLASNPDYKGKGLQLEFTVEDEEVFTAPWSGAISYRRPSGDWPEMACADNPHDYVGRGINLPQASKPDF